MILRRAIYGQKEVVAPITPTVLVPGDGTTAWNTRGSVTTGLGYFEPNGSATAWTRDASFYGVGSGIAFSLTFDLSTTNQGQNGIMFGVSEGNTIASWTELKYAFYFQRSNASDYRMFKAESGSITSLGTFSFGDSFEIKRDALGNFDYLHNGTSISTGATTNTNSMYGDGSIANNSALRIDEIKLTYIAPTVLVPGDGTTAWVDIVNMTTSLGKIVPPSSVTGWNKGASFGTVPANTDFTLSFNFVLRAGGTSPSYFLSGVSATNPDALLPSVGFGWHAFAIGTDNRMQIYESGIRVINLGNGTYTTGDLFEIKRVGTTITYLQNGTVKFTSSQSSTSSIVFDCCSYKDLGAENLKLTY